MVCALELFVEKLPRLPPQRKFIMSLNQLLELNPFPKLHIIFSQQSLEKLNIQLDELLQKEFIKPSVSPLSAPVLFVNKKNDITIRLCIDYRQLINITTRSKRLLSRIDDLFSQLQRVEFFSKFYSRSGSHQPGTNPKHISKTTLRTRYGHHESK